MRVAPRGLACGVALLTLGGAADAPPSAPSPPADIIPRAAQDDIRFVVSEAQRVQAADVAAWTAYRFGRRTERQDYDDSGRIVDRDELEFLVTPDKDGFREDLVRHNGVP